MTPVFLFLAAILLGPEHPAAPPTYGIPAGNLQGAAVASDGNDYLVLWPDFDRGFVSAARVSSSGELLSRPSFLVTKEAGGSINLFWLGDHYVAFWISNNLNVYDVRMARLDRNGALLEPVRTVVTNVLFQSMAWNGRHFMLALARGDALELMLVSPDGDVVKRDIGIPVLPVSGAFKVIAAGDTFWVIHSTQTTITKTDRFGNTTQTFFNTIYAHRVSAAGEVLDAQPQVILDHVDGWSGAAASNGRSILGVALEYGAQMVLRPFAIDTTTRAVTVLTTETPLRGGGPIAMTDGSRYLLSWVGVNNVLQTLPFDETAAPAATTPQECCHGVEYLPPLAWNGRSWLAAWGDTRDSLPQTSSLHLYGSVLDPNGHAADDGHPLASAARNQIAPSTAGALTVWAELDAISKYHEVRASLAGGSPVTLSQPALVESTAAVFTGSSYFVGWSERATWSSTPHVFLRRVGAAAPLPLGVGTAITFAFDGTNVLAVWLSEGGLAGQRFAPDGNVVDAVPFSISKSGGFRPRVAWNGSEYLVTWWEGTNYCWGGGAFCPPNLRDVNAARVSASGTVIDTIAIAGGHPDQHDPVVASDGRDFLIAYAQTDVDPATLLYVQRIFVKRVMANGSVIDAGSSVADGTPIDAAWRDHRYLIATAIPYPNYELRVREIDPLTAMTTGDTLISRYATSAQFFGEGSTIVYSRTTEEPVYGGAIRVFTRELFDATRRRTTR